MHTSFTAPTFIAIANLATRSAVEHCAQYDSVGSYPVTDSGFWYGDAIGFLRTHPETGRSLFAVCDMNTLTYSEAEALFKTAFASACASYFSAKK